MDTGKEFLNQSAVRFAYAFDRIEHVLKGLTDDQIWKKPSPESNSIGIIIQHITGNLSQWICEAVGGDRYKRNRPAEFKQESRHSKSVISESLRRLSFRIREILETASPDILLENKRIQGIDENVLSAIYKACTHLELHAGQIVYIAKLYLGPVYDEFWKPLNVEQGKE